MAKRARFWPPSLPEATESHLRVCIRDLVRPLCLNGSLTIFLHFLQYLDLKNGVLRCKTVNDSRVYRLFVARLQMLKRTRVFLRERGHVLGVREHTRHLPLRLGRRIPCFPQIAVQEGLRPPNNNHHKHITLPTDWRHMHPPVFCHKTIPINTVLLLQELLEYGLTCQIPTQGTPTPFLSLFDVILNLAQNPPLLTNFQLSHT